MRGRYDDLVKSYMRPDHRVAAQRAARGGEGGLAAIGVRFDLDKLINTILETRLQRLQACEGSVGPWQVGGCGRGRRGQGQVGTRQRRHICQPAFPAALLVPNVPRGNHAV